MKVTVNIDDRDFWALANKAEQQGVKVADLLAAMFRTGTAVPARGMRPVVLRDKVAELIDAGIPDPVIAHRLGEPLEMVRSVRRQLGLRPVRFDRRRWEHELSRPVVRAVA